MNDVKQELREGFSEALDDLRTMRDEIRLKVHLGGMEAKDQWKKLEPELGRLESEFEKGGDAMADVVTATAEELRKAFRKLRDDLHKPPKECC